MNEAVKTKTLLSNADLLVPEKPSSLSLSDALSLEDLYSLNTLPRVNIDDEQRSSIALNDLVMELNHFIDD